MRVRGLEAWRPFLTVSLTRRNFEKAQSAALDAGGKTKVTWSKGEILFPGRQGAFDYNVCAGRMRRKRLPEDRPEGLFLPPSTEGMWVHSEKRKIPQIKG